MNGTLTASFLCIAEIIEQGHAVGLGPDADFAGVLEDVGFAGRAVVLLDRPLRLAAAGLRGGPPGRCLAGLGIVEVDCASQRHTGEQRRAEHCYQERFHLSLTVDDPYFTDET